jgi:hypothetical protein
MSVENFKYPPRVISAFSRVWDSFSRDGYVRQSADDLHLLHHHKLMLKRKATHEDSADFDPGEWIFEFCMPAHELAAHLGIALS